MKLFEMKNWDLTVTEEAWGLSAFKRILDRDKSKGKTRALAEMLFVWFWCDIKSNYIIMDEDIRLEELKKDITNLPKDFKIDEVIEDAIKLYYKNSQSVIQKLYLQSLKSASDIGDYLENTKELLNERDVQGKPVYDIAKITTSVQRVPKLMGDLKLAYKEVVKEQEDNDNKKKGSRQFNTFEEGLTID